MPQPCVRWSIGRLGIDTPAGGGHSGCALWLLHCILDRTALHLSEPAFRLGAEVAGLFGIVGATGILLAPLAGKLADKRGPHVVALVGATIALGSWLIFFWWNAIPGLAVGVILLDIGVTSSLVSNQHLIFALRAEARSRLNTVLMTAMFVGGSLGSLCATWSYTNYGWRGVCVCGVVFAASGFLVQAQWYFSRSARNG